MPIRRSRTVTRCPARSPSVDSPTPAATAGTVTTSSSETRSTATSAVISFVMLAIARGASASRAASVWPSTELWTTYARGLDGRRGALGGGAERERGDRDRETEAHHAAPG